MTNHEKMKQAFSVLHMTGDYDSVLRKEHARRKRRNTVAAAVASIAIVLMAAGTAYAAVPEFRIFIVQLFSAGGKERLPVEKLSMDPAGKDGDVGNAIKVLEEQKIDDNFSVKYFSADGNISFIRQTGNTIYFKRLNEDGASEYYCAKGDAVSHCHSECKTIDTTIRLHTLPGICGPDGNNGGYANLELSDIPVRLTCEKIGDEYFIDDMDEVVTYGDKYEIGIQTHNLSGRKDLAVIDVLVDAQLTSYSYPLLINLSSGKISDPVSECDLSEFACITELGYSEDAGKAYAMAGSGKHDLRRITIDVGDKSVTGESYIEPPVGNYLVSKTISESEVFYVAGDELDACGYLYNADTKERKVIFEHAAWGYGTWEYGAAETYVEHYIYGMNVIMVQESENKVYILDIRSGEKTLLEGLPASHDLDFFWNDEASIMQVGYRTNKNIERKIFYKYGQKEAWYIDCTNPDGVSYESGQWIDENHYEEVSRDEKSGRRYFRIFSCMK